MREIVLFFLSKKIKKRGDSFKAKLDIEKLNWLILTQFYLLVGVFLYSYKISKNSQDKSKIDNFVRDMMNNENKNTEISAYFFQTSLI